MKYFGKKLIVLLSFIMVALILCSCGASADGEAVNEGYGAVYDDNLSKSADAAVKSDSQSSGTPEQVAQSRKIIEYVNFSVETKAFDQLIEDINATVKKSGGYIENSQIGGNSYYDSESRTAELKIRIPKSKQSDFSDFISKNSNVVSKSVNTEDVTDRYIDTQSRIKALTIEKETLEKLLSQSADISDTLTVYERLTNVIAEIESYQGKLNQMDNLIDYTTFTVYIDEVEKVTKIEKENWFVNTWNSLVDNLVDVAEGFLDFLSFIIAGLPFWIILAIIAAVVLLIIRRIKKKRAKKREAKQESIN